MGQNDERKRLRRAESSRTTQTKHIRPKKSKKNTIPEAQKSKRERDIKEEPIHKITDTGQYGPRSKETHKDRNCRYCDTPNWSPNDHCPARDVIYHKCEMKGRFPKACRFEQQKRQEIEELMETVETEESDTGRSINIITEINYLTERRN